MKYYLAVDIGASSGRHILAHKDSGKIILEEIYRFENKVVNKNGTLCWELDRLFNEILNGLKKCSELGKIPESMGIDTWGVDFVLLDENNKVLGDTVAYRDSRTEGIDKELYKIISQDELYRRTGIQKQLFNTIYQLYAIKLSNPEYIEKAESFLMVPEYFNYLLTKVKKNEYTNATTGQLVNAKTKTWDMELIEKTIGNTKMFGELNLPKTEVGYFSEEIAKEVGFTTKVILPATHDTGSAVLAVPSNNDDFIYLSSGTWSLMGIERREADCSKESESLNFTNEGGYDYRFRYLKNIMGLWMLQNVRKELNNKYTYPEIASLAIEASDFDSIVDVNDASFLAPDSMIDAVKAYCKKTNQQVPDSINEVLSCIYKSLAKSYMDTVNEIEKITNKTFSTLHIVGGGCQDRYLNELTKTYTKKEVYAGPIEGTALGNIMVQMIKDGEFEDLSQARAAVAKSFDIKKI